MKTLLLFIGLGIGIAAFGQTPLSRALCDMTLAIQSEDGTNGVAVTYNPTTNLYYTAFAGNSVYPLEVFDASGRFISTQEIGYDVRGLWYNPTTKSLEGIMYGNTGSFSMKLNADGGISGSSETMFSYGMDDQTVGTFNPQKKMLLFVEGMTAYLFKPGKQKSKKITLSPTVSDIALNTNGPIYTGIKHYEIGLLEAETMTVHLFSASSGKETASVQLGNGTCAALQSVPSNFRVSYCNERVFLFDTVSRSWTGYKIF